MVVAEKLTALFAVLILIFATPAAASPVDSLMNEINLLKQDVERGQGELVNLDIELERTTKEIIRIYQELDSQEDLLEVSRKTLNGRIQVVYKNYDELLLSIFLDAHSFTDLWKRFAFLARINKADKELVAANKFRAEKVRSLKEELAAKKTAQVELKHRKKWRYEQLEQNLAAKKTELELRIQEIKANQAAAAAANPPATGAAAIDPEAPPTLN